MPLAILDVAKLRLGKFRLSLPSLVCRLLDNEQNILTTAEENVIREKMTTEPTGTLIPGMLLSKHRRAHSVTPLH